MHIYLIDLERQKLRLGAKIKLAKHPPHLQSFICLICPWTHNYVLIWYLECKDAETMVISPDFPYHLLDPSEGRYVYLSLTFFLQFFTVSDKTLNFNYM